MPVQRGLSYYPPDISPDFGTGPVMNSKRRSRFVRFQCLKRFFGLLRSFRSFDEALPDSRQNKTIRAWLLQISLFSLSTLPIRDSL
jgi:hypothetical protein